MEGGIGSRDLPVGGVSGALVMLCEPPEWDRAVTDVKPILAELRAFGTPCAVVSK